jgi:hypothetical protein
MQHAAIFTFLFGTLSAFHHQRHHRNQIAGCIVVAAITGAYKWSRLIAVGTSRSDTYSISCGVIRQFDSKFCIVDVYSQH